MLMINSIKLQSTIWPYTNIQIYKGKQNIELD
jgi:hypothetical protein